MKTKLILSRNFRCLLIISLLLTAAMYINLMSSNAFNALRHEKLAELMTADALSREPTVIKYGIDVSFWQGDIDWSLVAQTRTEFVMIRAGFGAYDDTPMGVDSRFREYITGALENGLDIGVYFFSYAETINDIKEEARFLVDLIKDYRVTYPVVLDMEETREDYIDCPSEMAESFLEIIMASGYFPMMYSYKYWLEGNLTQSVRDKYAVWVAHYDVPATTYRGGNYYMWQYSDKGRVTGINGNVDLNIAYRDFSGYIKRVGLNGLHSRLTNVPISD